MSSFTGDSKISTSLEYTIRRGHGCAQFYCAGIPQVGYEVLHEELDSHGSDGLFYLMWAHAYKRDVCLLKDPL